MTGPARVRLTEAEAYYLAIAGDLDILVGETRGFKIVCNRLWQRALMTRLDHPAKRGHEKKAAYSITEAGRVALANWEGA